jgi:hypothetical protein
MMVNETRDSSLSLGLVAAPHTLAAGEVAAHLDVRPESGLTRGRAELIVTATGADTEMGRL